MGDTFRGGYFLEFAQQLQFAVVAAVGRIGGVVRVVQLAGIDNHMPDTDLLG